MCNLGVRSASNLLVAKTIIYCACPICRSKNLLSNLLIRMTGRMLTRFRMWVCDALAIFIMVEFCVYYRERKRFSANRGSDKKTQSCLPAALMPVHRPTSIFSSSIKL